VQNSALPLDIGSPAGWSHRIGTASPHVRDAPDAAVLLPRSAEFERPPHRRNCHALTNGEDLFRVAGINASIGDLKYSANTLYSVVQSLLDQIETLDAHFASLGDLQNRYPLIAFFANYGNLLAEMDVQLTSLEDLTLIE